MFTGIIESQGIILSIDKEGSNANFIISSSISSELKVDQSLSHNGVCLTVVGLGEDCHMVTAIEETLLRTTLGDLKEGNYVNLERAMKGEARFDGHMVQGHVDSTAECFDIEEKNGSWLYTFRYSPNDGQILVDKGSVCINGVSLTVVNPEDELFSVAIIPFTYEHTNFKDLKTGDTVNIEFDIIGKYIAKYLKLGAYSSKFAEMA